MKLGSLRKNIIKLNKSHLTEWHDCLYREAMFEFTNNAIKDLGFSMEVCRSFWQDRVKNKLISDSNVKNTTIESEKIYLECLRHNPELDSYLAGSIFNYGVPSKLILMLMDKIYKKIIQDKLIKKSVAMAICELQLKKKKYLLITCSNATSYLSILSGLMRLESDDQIRFINIFQDFQRIRIQSEKSSRHQKYNFADQVVVSECIYMKEKYILKLIYNTEYRDYKYTLIKQDKSNRNFVPFKKFEYTVSCSLGSLCVEPILINWLFRKKVVKHDFDLYACHFGAFYIKTSDGDLIYNNKNVIGCNKNDNFKNKLYERIVIGYLYHLFKDIDFMTAYLDVIRRLMTPCAGCFLNHDKIKKNIIEPWSTLDCDRDCSRYRLDGP